jgi:hypothetical protein
MNILRGLIMRTIRAITAIAALAAACCLTQLPAEALGLRVGPFYFHVPFGYRHHHHYAHSSSSRTASLREEESSPAEATPERDHVSGVMPVGDLNSPLLYPALAVPTMLSDIFWRSSSSWPFSYEAIFRAAFAKVRPDQDSSACPEPASANATVGRIRGEIRPTAAQTQQLQKLAGALGVAADYLAKTCPKDIPLQPVARLQMMEWQIEKLAEALDIVRQPLADFQQSLTDAQRARFAAAPSPGSSTVHADRGDAVACAVAPTAIDWSIEQISLSVQPTDAQRDAIDNVKQAFRSAAGELDGNCSAPPPPDPLARLQATQARLDATWRALVSIQTALATLENGLSAEQRVRFDATDFAAAQ